MYLQDLTHSVLWSQSTATLHLVMHCGCITFLAFPWTCHIGLLFLQNHLVSLLDCRHLHGLLILLSSHIYLPVTLGDCSLITYFRAIARLYYIPYLSFLLFLHSTYQQPKLLCFTYCSFVHCVFLCLVCKCYEGKKVYIFTQPIHLIIFGRCISRAILHMSIHPSKLGSSWQTKVWVSPKSLCEPLSFIGTI